MGKLLSCCWGLTQNVNAPAAGHDGETALQAAAGKGHNEILKLLLGAGADVSAPALSYGGRTALQAAAGNGHDETVKLLLSDNADVNAPALGNQRAPLQAAAENLFKLGISNSKRCSRVFPPQNLYL